MGKCLFKEQNLVKMSKSRLRKVQGVDISMIFQDPMTALNPTLQVGEQLTEGLRTHQKVSKAAAYTKAIEMLESRRYSKSKRTDEAIPTPIFRWNASTNCHCDRFDLRA